MLFDDSKRTAACSSSLMFVHIGTESSFDSERNSPSMFILKRSAPILEKSSMPMRKSLSESFLGGLLSLFAVIASFLCRSILPQRSGHESAKIPNKCLSLEGYCRPLENCRSGSKSGASFDSSHRSSYSKEKTSLPLNGSTLSFPISVGDLRVFQSP